MQPFSEATLAGVAQTAGDLTAAIMMQVIPVFVSNDYDPDELDCFRNLVLSHIHVLTSSNIVQAIFGGWSMIPDSSKPGRSLHHLTSQPYNLSFALFTWVLFNGGMVSPILPVAITAQILMGTTYVSRQLCEETHGLVQTRVSRQSHVWKRFSSYILTIYITSYYIICAYLAAFSMLFWLAQTQDSSPQK